MEKAHSGHATVSLEIKNTDGIEDKTQIPIAPRIDLAKVKNDERLRGFKVQQIAGEGDRAAVRFAIGEELTPFRSIFFRTEKGQHSAEQPSEVLAIDIVYSVFDVIGRAAKETSLTRVTLNRIFDGLSDAAKRLMLRNPEGFSALFIAQIENVLADHVANGIEFVVEEQEREYNEDELFPEVKSFVQKELTTAGVRGLYDRVQWDSEVELRFVEKRLKTSEDRLVCYFKFPPLFKITLPKIIGNYNPDWGIVCYDDSGKLKLHLVRETKGSLKLSSLQFPTEGRKIVCAAKHFAKLGISYRHITDDVLRWWSDGDSPDPTKLF